MYAALYKGGSKLEFPVIKGASYILVNTPDIVINNGTTQTMEREANPDSDYLKKLKNSLRSFQEVVDYPPNQTYIGNITPEDLREIKRPWYQNNLNNCSRYGKFGEIMPEDEFYALLKLSDVFDLVILQDSFAAGIKDKLKEHPILKDKLEKIGSGVPIDEIKNLVKNGTAEGLYINENLAGCVKRAHEKDPNLSAHIMLENLSVKASGVLALLNLVYKNNLDPGSVEYVIECSEEAIGDMNQRGGGNIAKACAEIAGFNNATGTDMRGFCAGPTHALITAAAYVKSGIYENVVVFGGGATAKLGMNGKDHVRKGIPALEDCLGGFAVLISKNDGVSPVLRTDIIGRHTVGDGASPQNVISSLVLNPLTKAGLKITDIDKYAPEMQTPDITESAGAGDVPTQNYKMIGALAVKAGQLDKKDLMNFVSSHGYPGFAPTQGHIPSGVPIIGHGIKKIMNGSMNNFMVIGKGSLFLGRMTNQFDGVSIVVEKNNGEKENSDISKDEIKIMIANKMEEFAKTLLK